ncbi:hypothetical protein LTR37_010533 [Vermiconidia calcicola]|uniref:Uncharacterized protein n=1 Tax=Vermiconidia calcicola TaxID=1690605 RepID=A0ACC3N6G1_9PEZI|nr:hypothetical protein LTR37_010533 [Vermiconidia calcicola]
MDLEPTDEGIEELYGSGLYPGIDTEGGGYGSGIQLIDDRETKDFLRGRLSSDTPNIGLYKSWLHSCQSHHVQTCSKGRMSSTRPHPAAAGIFTIIDVKSRCLCDMPAAAEYVALSYVWGDNNKPVTLKSNVEAFRLPKGLDIDLPDTILDAINLVEALDYRYLWVDSLCITQDDEPNKMRLIAWMDKVYSDAAFTIVAATGKNASSGLSGFRRSSRRTIVQTLGPNFRLEVLPFFDREMMDSDNASRGWTYQETCLSPRCLIFLNGFTYFACSTMLWSEHIMAEVPGVAPIRPGANTLGKSGAEYPLRRYAEHVNAYTSRVLRYHSDALNAFAGIASAVARDLNYAGMRFGMPASVFDWAILWDTTRTQNPIQRRVHFPSWAWVDWESIVHMPLDTYSLYDQKWLLKGTWIDWWRMDAFGRFDRMWETATSMVPVSALAAKVIQSGSSPSRIPSEDEANSVLEEEGEEEEDEEELCPSYGVAYPSNPYGRVLPPSISSMLPTDQSDATPILQSDRVLPDALFFSTFVITSPSLRQVDFGEMYHIIDADGDACGFVNAPITGPSSQEYHIASLLLLLSVAPYGVLSSSRSDIAKLSPRYRMIDPTYLDRLPEDLDLFDYFNVMVVRPCGASLTVESGGISQRIRVYERVGIGLVHRGIFQAGEGWPQWKPIALR